MVSEKSTAVDNPTTLGALIRKRRKELGYTQQRVSGLAGVGARFLSELERGKTTAEIGKVLRVLQLLGLDLWVKPRAKASDADG